MASFECNALQIEESAGFLTLWLNRPEVRNAFNAELINDLYRFTQWIRDQDGIRAVFLRGRGKVFCAGGDLHWMKNSLEWDTQTNYEDSAKLSAMFTALNQIPKPLIGVVQGGAYGGGVGLVAVCDHVVAEKQAVFSLSEVRLGLIPACIGPFVVDKVGLSHCRSLFISGSRFAGPRALEIGLVHEVVDGVADLDDRVVSLSKIFLNCGPHAIRTAKQFLRQIKGMSFTDANDLAGKTLADLRVGKEAQEGIRAFLEKRKPQW